MISSTPQPRLAIATAAVALLVIALVSIPRATAEGRPASGERRLFLTPTWGRLSSPLGWRVDPFHGDWRHHWGIDIASPQGTPVVASYHGQVTYGSAYGGYGNVVVIDHGGGWATLYGHLSGVAVTPGQRVQRGTVVGYVGSTGRSTAPHLHFEIRHRGVPVDPLKYLAR